jgi:XTP/dITP diphosphohydrolase
MLKLVMATGNSGKLKEFKALTADLPVQVLSLQDFKHLPEIIEDGNSFKENALIKAKTIAEATGYMTLSDDSGLVVDALQGEPGIYSARYALLDGVDISQRDIDQANNQKLLDKLQGMGATERMASFQCCLCLYVNDAAIYYAQGKLEGAIGVSFRGSQGFGYDPLFYVPSYGCTLAELPLEEKNKISHRAQAFQLMKDTLKNILKN